VHERIIGLYTEYALEWDAQRGRDLHERPWLDRFAALLAPGAEILDLGCGSGEPIARDLIERGFSLTGVDPSAPLIELCRRRFPDRPWIVADMRELELGRRFDGIIAWHSLFHLPPDDQRRLFTRLARHLRGGGALMFTSGDEAGETIGTWRGEALFHASLDPGEYESRLAENGFAVVERRLRDPECGDSSVWLARRTAED
jgi:SAM-dependent methyltransferase